MTRSGTRSARLSMFPEAMQQFSKALAILEGMPADRSRDSRELKLQLAIGECAYMYEGEHSADAGKALARVVELALFPEDTAQKARALLLLGAHHCACGELRRAAGVSQALYELVQEMRNPELEF